MRISRGWTAVFSVIFLTIILGVFVLVSRPRGPVVVDAAFRHDTITPNADGDTDLTELSYRVRRSAMISIYFQDESGERYYFRRDSIRSRGEYAVQFSGIVEGYSLPDDSLQAEVLTRLLTDGEYTWVIEAEGAITGSIDRVEGTIAIRDADVILPDLWELTVSPEVFTPNQDGLNDLVWINIYVPKEADLDVFLVAPDGQQYYVPESLEGRKEGEEGRHTFIYDGGVDMGRNPPPDGAYTILVESQDAEGQRMRRTSEVSIASGGLPLAEIVGQPIGDTVNFSAEAVRIGDVLYFELTVENYGEAPIRTAGPESGYVYDQSELYSTAGYYVQSGAWRVGIGCDTCLTDYPWRWALGSFDELSETVVDGFTQYYLMPGQRVTVTGGIRIENAVESRNPQQFWAGLIHEDVAIAPRNQRVDPHWILFEENAPDS